MATTGIWKIGKRLDNVLVYTTNIEKTKNSEYTKEPYCNLHNVIEYVEADYKTEKQLYVTGINCEVETALQEMMITKESFNKTGGILGFHAFQSFKEGEVTPELAHKIGVKLAEEMWGDRFEVVVSTHLNTKHYHNHFVINSVSFVDGKRYYDKRETYAELRKISDSICEEYGLSKLKEKSCKRSKINYANYQKGNFEKNNYYTKAKEDLDRAIVQAYDYKDFCNLMKAMDYEVMIRYDKISIRRKGYKNNIRIERYFGEDYSIDRINERIETTYAPRIPFIEVFGNVKYEVDKKTYTKPKHKGFYGLYLHYCYLLKVFPVKNPKQRLSAEIRADIRKMDKISEEARLLVSNDLKTNEQFFCFKEEKEKRLKELTDKRYELWYKHKKANSVEEKEILSSQIDEINKELNPIRKEVVLCDDRNVLDNKKENGKFIGSVAPFGYIKDPNNKHNFIVDKKAAKIVKKIFEMILNGKSKKEVIDELNRLEIPTPSIYKIEEKMYNYEIKDKMKKWNTKKLDKILKNSSYTGELVQGKRKRISYKVHKDVEVNPDEWIIIKNHHKAIISQADFDKVQELLYERTIRVKKNKEYDLFAGHLRCSECGNNLTLRKSKGKEYYYCTSYIYKKNCTSHSCNKSVIETTVINIINQYKKLINEMSVATCANNIYEIWNKTSDKKSAQLVFCDLSTPHNDGKFNVYDDLKSKLIERGIPEEEISFIHEANTDVRKQELFNKVRKGQVRVLMGSTQKMGAGTNCQDRLIALHDLDCPWRPSDLTQRSGRIIRQGNMNSEVSML